MGLGTRGVTEVRKKGSGLDHRKAFYWIHSERVYKINLSYISLGFIP
jgi:hypothetical protein